VEYLIESDGNEYDIRSISGPIPPIPEQVQEQIIENRANLERLEDDDDDLNNATLFNNDLLESNRSERKEQQDTERDMRHRRYSSFNSHGSSSIQSLPTDMEVEKEAAFADSDVDYNNITQTHTQDVAPAAYDEKEMDDLINHVMKAMKLSDVAKNIPVSNERVMTFMKSFSERVIEDQDYDAREAFERNMSNMCYNNEDPTEADFRQEFAKRGRQN
jgi:hypothetical protein